MLNSGKLIVFMLMLVLLFVKILYVLLSEDDCTDLDKVAGVIVSGANLWQNRVCIRPLEAVRHSFF